MNDPRRCSGLAARGTRAAGCSNAARLIRCDLADHRPKLARSEPIEIVLAFLLPSLSGGLSRDGDTGRTSCDAFFVQSQRLHWLFGVISSMAAAQQGSSTQQAISVNPASNPDQELGRRFIIKA